MVSDFKHRIEKIPFEQFYFYLLCLCAFSLSTTRFVLSNSIIALTFFWILEGKWNVKLQILKSSKGILIFIGLFALHVVGLLNTSNFSYAYEDLKIKVPILILPLIIGTSPAIDDRKLFKILQFLLLGVGVYSIVSILIFSGITGKNFTDVRQCIGSIGAIRLSLLINIAIFSVAYFLKYKGLLISRALWWILAISVIWLSAYLFILQSLTGIFIFLLILGGIVLYSIFVSTKLALKLVFTGIFLISITFSFFYVRQVWVDFYPKNPRSQFQTLDRFTVNGTAYLNDTNSIGIENGNYVWIYLAHSEIRREWNKKSRYKYDSVDKKGQLLQSTLFRYLTSKNLRKDSVGVSKLSQRDIQNIEQGIANYKFDSKFSLYPKIYQLIWQYHKYINVNNLDGQSISQRMIYLQLGYQIIKENFWFGVGTGDVDDVYHEMYKKGSTRLSPQFQHRAHNQLVTFWISFGVIGFVLCIICIFLPVFLQKRWNSFLVILILTISILSMLDEDTLEGQVGASFFAFFYALSLFGYQQSELDKSI